MSGVHLCSVNGHPAASALCSSCVCYYFRRRRSLQWSPLSQFEKRSGDAGSVSGSKSHREQPEYKKSFITEIVLMIVQNINGKCQDFGTSPPFTEAASTDLQTESPRLIEEQLCASVCAKRELSGPPNVWRALILETKTICGRREDRDRKRFANRGTRWMMTRLTRTSGTAGES